MHCQGPGRNMQELLVPKQGKEAQSAADEAASAQAEAQQQVCKWDQRGVFEGNPSMFSLGSYPSCREARKIVCSVHIAEVLGCGECELYSMAVVEH